MKEWTEENKEILKAKKKIYLEKNKEAVRLRKTIYREKQKKLKQNVDGINHILCECGGIYKTDYSYKKIRHDETKKHQTYIHNQTINNNQNQTINNITYNIQNLTINN